MTGALGAGNFQAGVISESTGTVLALCGVTDTPPYDEQRRFCLFPHAIEGRFVAMPWASASGSILAWFRDNFVPGLDYESLTAEAAAVAAGSDGLTVLPHFEGINLPVRIVEARGVFWGVTPSHRRGHFARAIMESVAFLLKDYVSILEQAGIGGRQVISLGGAARSALWSQIKADVLEKPVVTNRVNETVCLGAAMIAAAGAGLYRDCEEACRKMVQPKRTFTPSEAAGTYRSLYGQYTRLNELHRSFYDGLRDAPGAKEPNHG
ncbi:MAG: Xylulose kinase [candidate division TA06 bacterium ADurb.Bin417]|uniref:Xylulose kinase n=1 Tax=candidate division TA06 bacterium ADurb.Bin417 TaxID=1852828 RepID=A0A1V5MCF6_UNCT6|nr:MAG: Xylulose kinase [candidate division TA06 bacterium ADurb.Bin417]